MDKNKIIQAATKYVQKGQLDKAIAEYQKVIREDPRDVRILLKVGELHQKRGDNALAANMLLQVAESYSADGFFLKAVAVYKQILKLDPSRIDVNVKLAELYQQLGLMSDAMGQFQLVANHYDREGKLTELSDVLRRMVDLDPENVASRIKLAEMFAKQGATRDAIAEFRKAATFLKANNRPDDYVKVGERIVFLDPSDVALSRELANVHLARGDTKRALAKLQACFKTDPRDVETLSLLARAFQELGQASKTVAVYKELARVHGESERVDDERATWRKVLELDPEDAEARAALAQRSTLTPGPPAVAPPAPVARAAAASPPPRPAPAAVARPAAAPRAPASPQDPVGKLLTETDVYVKYGLHDKALEHLRKVFALDPSHLEAHEKVAELLLAAGNHAAGQEELVTVCRLCVERGELERGRAHFQQLLALAPHLPAVGELMPVLGGDAGDDDGGMVIESADDLVEADGDAVVIDGGDDDAGIEIVSDADPEEDDSTRDFVLPQGMVAEEEIVLAPDPDGIDDVMDEPLFGADVPEEELTGEIDLALSGGPQAEPEPEPLPEAELIDSTPGPEEDGDPALELAAAAAADVVVEEPALEASFALDDASLDHAALDDAAELSVEPLGVELPGDRTSVDDPVEAPPDPFAAAAPEPPVNPWGLDPDDLAEIDTELQEAEFFIAQDLLEEAEEACRSILFRAPGHPVATARLAEIEALRAPPAPAPVEEDADVFDLAAELASEVGPESPAPAGLDDFQYSVEDVLEEFKRGVSLTVKPEDTQTHYDLGIAYKEMGLLQEAIGEFEVALQGSRGKPAEVECLHMLGICKAALGRPLEAVGYFERALAAPRIGDEAARAIEFELATSLEQCGDVARALHHFGKVAQRDAGYRDVGQAVARLEAAGIAPAPPPDRDGRADLLKGEARAAGPARKIGYV
jgi:pilus assembly protein FimV